MYFCNVKSLKIFAIFSNYFISPKDTKFPKGFRLSIEIFSSHLYNDRFELTEENFTLGRNSDFNGNFI